MNIIALSSLERRLAGGGVTAGFLALLTVCLPASGAQAQGSAERAPVDVRHSLLIAVEHSSQISVIDTEADRIVSTIDLALEPSELALSTVAGRLVAIHKQRAIVTLLDLSSFAERQIPLSFIPTMLTLSADGLTVSVANPEEGTVAFFDVLKGRVIGPVTGAAPIRNMVFSADGAVLYVSGGTAPGIAAIDSSRGIPLPRLQTTSLYGTAFLRRSANGRLLYAKPVSGGKIDVFDLPGKRTLPPISVATGVAGAFPSALGGYLLLPDNENGTMAIEHDGAAVATPARGPRDVENVYTAWFDTVAFVPSAASRSLFVYDLETGRLDSEIAVAGIPFSGGVTSDGAKFYLILRDKADVLVFAGETHRQIVDIPLPSNPVFAVLSGNYGVCH